MADENDPLAEFRGGEVQMGGISRKIAGQVHPAVFRQISQSATSDQMAGDPRHYEAFVPGERQEQLEFRRVLGAWHALCYRFLVDVITNGKFGTEIVLEYPTHRVKISGHNLLPLKQAIYARTCEYVQEYHENEFSPPDPDATVITKIEIEVKGEEAGMAERKSDGKGGDAAANRTRPGKVRTPEDELA